MAESDTCRLLGFPDGFLWGVATAAPQIEGGLDLDGRGESIWDRFARRGGVAGGLGALEACDHYRRWEEDVAHLADLGVGAYRFSVAWPRVFPTGGGRPDRRGLDFYRRLVDALVKRAVRPAVTLYHWDLPQALQDRGGWANRDTAYRFCDYAATLFRHLGADVPLWMTHNEPFVVAYLGHVTGEHAPGLRRPWLFARVAHHLLVSHGLAVRAFRQLAPAGSRIGITLFLWPQQPASDRPADVAAARRADAAVNRWFLDALLKGDYPADVRRYLARRLAGPPVRPGDAELIAEPIDFLGVQYYSRVVHRADPWNLFQGSRQLPPAGPTTAMGWEIYPEGLYEVLTRIHRDYGPVPLYVTECGAAFDDRPAADGRVHDPQRVAYLRDHLVQLHRALTAGVDVRGLFVWSLMDNLEWHHGLDRRFGLLYVDFDHGRRRIPKASFAWFREVVRQNAVAMPGPAGGGEDE